MDTKNYYTISKKNALVLSAGLTLLFLIVGFFVYKNVTFVDSTHPLNSAIDIPLHTTISVEGNFNFKIGQIVTSVKYKNDSTPINIYTRGNEKKIIFIPDLLLPNKEVEVQINSHTFSFHTVQQSNDPIDLYRSVFKSFFRSPQNSSRHMPDSVVLEWNNNNQLSIQDMIIVAQGLQAYHPNIFLKTQKELKPIGLAEKSANREDILTIKVETLQNQNNKYTVSIIASRTGLEKESKDVVEGKYEVSNVQGNWQVEVLSESSNRPWGYLINI